MATVTRHYRHGRMESRDGWIWDVHVDDAEGECGYLGTYASLAEAERHYFAWWQD